MGEHFRKEVPASDNVSFILFMPFLFFFYDAVVDARGKWEESGGGKEELSRTVGVKDKC